MQEKLLLKFFLPAAMLLFIHTLTVAQRLENADTTEISVRKKKLEIGFNYHLQLSHLDIAPVAIFTLHNRVQFGFGANYLYHYRNSVRLQKSSIGANVFTRVFVTKNIYTHFEYLYSDAAYLNRLVYEYTRIKKADFFVGVGYRQPLSDKINGTLSLLVNLNKTAESPYKNLLLLKAGISF